MEEIKPKEIFKEVKLTTEEAARWIKFHEDVYKEDQKMANKVITDSPRWSIIMAYYAMHNVSKLYLAKIHNIKISGEDVHAKTLFFISKYAKQDAKKIIPLLEKAKEEYDAITSSSIWVIPRLLSKGRDERTKTQYYNAVKAEKSTMELMQAAQYFMDNFMKPYIKIMEGLF
ncbi:MAG: hypothetical protein KKA61_04060 [Nanoarchaeota archaeon]|nr:hypothetical protein [Nanoarchaeota archaeon]